VANGGKAAGHTRAHSVRSLLRHEHKSAASELFLMVSNNQ
jgi:hypothetical protein